ncbi:MAG: DNA polymerase I [Proteobacteria bacterium]|nr:DNA polymerase I [Pseudomonadota bacterium]
MKKIALIDGYGFVFRAYHSLPPLSRNDGTPVGAVFGFTNMLIKLVASLEVSHLAVVFDSGSKTFRNEIYPKYKTNRPPCPEDLIPQFSIVRECVEALNIAVIEKIGFEADDIIATIAKKSAQENFQVIIVSSDKDLMQLVDNNISMFDAMKNKFIGFDEVYEKFMVKPDKVLDVLALMGDTSDNVPGVKGIGPKTASELINEFGSIENLYQNLDHIKQEKRRKVLQENQENAFLSKKLIQLDENVNLGIEIDDLKSKNLEPNKLISFLDNQGFKSLVYRVKQEFKISNNDIPKNNQNPDNNSSIAEQKSSSPRSDKNTNHQLESLEINNFQILEKIYSEARNKGAIIIDYLIENDNFSYITLCPVNEDQKKHQIYYKSFKQNNSFNNHQIDLLNFSDVNNNNIINQINITSFDKILFDNSIKKVFFNGKVFLRFYKNFIRQNNLPQNKNSIIFDDINLLTYMANSAVHNSLREIIDINLDTNFEELGYGEILDKIHQNNSSNNFTDFFSNDDQKVEFFSFLNNAIFRLYQIFAPKIIELKMYNSYLKNELPLLEVLADIEYNGININVEKLSQLATEFNQQISKLSAQIFELSGQKFNISSSKQLGEILFDKLGLHSTKKSKKTKAPSTNVKVLEDLAFEGHEIAQKIIDFRKYTKLNNTYCESLPKQVNQLTNRIHTTLSSTSTLTGRLTSINPNLQNIPIKSSEGKKIRECFVAPKNHVLISADYSQIELRILAHLAGINDLIEAFNFNKDIHKTTASQIFGVAENFVDEEMRNKAKTINFGIIYGISPYGLSRQLKISNKEASEYIKSYFEKYSGIKEFMQSNIDFARQNGFVETISKRKCFINDINNKNPIIRQEAERQAINAPIQGSSADIIKKAMIKLRHSLIENNLKSKIVLQIHDELLIEAPENEVEKITEILRVAMTETYKLVVDLKVDFSINQFWG